MEKAGSSGMGRTSFLVAVWVILVAAAIMGWSSNRSQMHKQTSHFETKLFELQRNISEDVREGAAVLLIIKLLNFCVAKFVQMRYLSLTQIASDLIGSILFWIVLTRSVFDLYN